MTDLVRVESLLKRRPRASAKVDLTTYDWIAVSSSAGKDSQAMLDYIAEQAREAGVSDRVVVIHSDLGRVEWEGTHELAKEQADHYGFRFELTSRIGGTCTRSGKVYEKGDTFGDILDYAERRGSWPSSTARWCTSEFKRGPILRVFTALAREWKKSRPKGSEKRACRILDCQGLRAQESPARAKKVAFVERKRTKNQAVDTWLPIHAWTTEQVWERIRKSGVRHHQAYDLGMPRLSCVFCIFAPKAALVTAGRHNRALLDEYVRVEKKTGHKFRMDVSLEEVAEAVDAGDTGGTVDDAWNM